MFFVKKGDWVKIALEGERFWVKVISASGQLYEGIIDNELLNTEKHGLRLGSQVAFDKDLILDVMDGSGEIN